jgi:hypothetical protein
MALTAAWFAISGAACVLVARRRRALRIPVMAAYILTAVAVGAYLGALKGNRGNQQYAIPPGIDVNDRVVVIWCRAFSAPFGSAQLRQT